MASRRQAGSKSGEAGSKSGTGSRLIDSRRHEIRQQLAIFGLLAALIGALIDDRASSFAFRLTP